MNELTPKQHRENLLKTFIEIKLIEDSERFDPDDKAAFRKIRETLTRIGIKIPSQRKLIQICHILHKKGQYYIVHHKELFQLDGINCTLTDEDLDQRDYIAMLISQWGICEILSLENIDQESTATISVIKNKDKSDWILCPKYSIGGDRVKQ